ncbi:MAG: hypothetical protein QOH60_3914 [Mycobacterium sp.]|nr:hypothetical protein [Mycobacterium sp.]
MAMTVHASVADTTALSRRFCRVVLQVPDLAALQLPAAADAAVGIYFSESATPTGRTYTVRAVDSAECLVTVDVLLHGDAIGTDWAQRTRPGEEVTLAYPNSWYLPPEGTESQLLVADLAGFPALARIIEGLPPEADAVAIVEVLDADDLDYLPRPPAVEIVSSVGTGNGVADSALPRLVMMQQPGHGYCWFAGEAHEARAIRKYLRNELRWEIDQLDVMGYWRRDSADWDRRYASVGATLFAGYQTAIAQGVAEKLAAEQFDEALEGFGL